MIIQCLFLSLKNLDIEWYLSNAQNQWKQNWDNSNAQDCSLNTFLHFKFFAQINKFKLGLHTHTHKPKSSQVHLIPRQFLKHYVWGIDTNKLLRHAYKYFIIFEQKNINWAMNIHSLSDNSSLNCQLMVNNKKRT